MGEEPERERVVINAAPVVEERMAVGTMSPGQGGTPSPGQTLREWAPTVGLDGGQVIDWLGTLGADVSMLSPDETEAVKADLHKNGPRRVEFEEWAKRGGR